MGEACRAFETPVTGGNVSLYNENPRGAIYPTPTIGMVGVIDDVAHVTTMGFKAEGDAIVLLGREHRRARRQRVPEGGARPGRRRRAGGRPRGRAAAAAGGARGDPRRAGPLGARLRRGRAGRGARGVGDRRPTRPSESPWSSTTSCRSALLFGEAQGRVVVSCRPTRSARARASPGARRARRQIGRVGAPDGRFRIVPRRVLDAATRSELAAVYYDGHPPADGPDARPRRGRGARLRGSRALSSGPIGAPRLTPRSQEIRYMCGIVAVSGVPDAAKLVFLGSTRLQHRGRRPPASWPSIRPRAAGDAGSTRRRAWSPTPSASGARRARRAPIALGHIRYSTAGGAGLHNAQPLLVRYARATWRWRTTATSPTRRSCGTAWSRGRALPEQHRLRVDRPPDRPLAPRRGRRADRRRALAARGRVLRPDHRRRHAVRRARPARLPPAGARHARRRLRARLGDVRARHHGRRFVRDLEPGEVLRIRDGELTQLRPLAPYSRPGAVHLRARLLRTARLQALGPLGRPRAPRLRPAARRSSSRRRRTA
jgi:hypothetical protein